MGRVFASVFFGMFLRRRSQILFGRNTVGGSFFQNLLSEVPFASAFWEWLYGVSFGIVCLECISEMSFGTAFGAVFGEGLQGVSFGVSEMPFRNFFRKSYLRGSLGTVFVECLPRVSVGTTFGTFFGECLSGLTLGVSFGTTIWDCLSNFLWRVDVFGFRSAFQKFL